MKASGHCSLDGVLVFRHSQMIQVRGSWPKAARAIDRDLGESFVWIRALDGPNRGALEAKRFRKLARLA